MMFYNHSRILCAMDSTALMCVVPMLPPRCMAPHACDYCTGQHCLWEYKIRSEPNIVPICALGMIWEHSTES